MRTETRSASLRTLRSVRGPEGAVLARVRKASLRSVDAAEEDDVDDDDDDDDDDDEEDGVGKEVAGWEKAPSGDLAGDRVSHTIATSSSGSRKRT